MITDTEVTYWGKLELVDVSQIAHNRKLVLIKSNFSKLQFMAPGTNCLTTYKLHFFLQRIDKCLTRKK